VSTISLVIPTWQRAPWLERCLAAVRRQDRRPDEIIVVLRAEDQDGWAVVRRATAGVPALVRAATVERPGHIAPVQRGLEVATGDVVAFLDDDTEPESRWLAALTEPFADARVACVGGRVVAPGFRGRVHPDAGAIRWYGRHIGNVGEREDAELVEVSAVMEGNCAWRRDVLTQLEFDPVLDFDDSVLYSLDLCLQARALGYRVVYRTAARVTHHAAPRSADLDRGDRPRRLFCYSRNYTYIALKHFGGLQRAAFFAWWWLVGDGGGYGLARSLERLRHARGAAAEIRASWAGKAEGWRRWRQGGKDAAARRLAIRRPRAPVS
jgi:GT2 family glycosyltransferase